MQALGTSTALVAAAGYQPGARDGQRLLAVLLAVVVCSLFSGIELHPGGISLGQTTGPKLRPFDVLTPPIFLVWFITLPPSHAGSGIRLLPGLLSVLPFFLVHTTSAFLFDRKAGLIEGTQVLMVLSLAVVIANAFRVISLVLFMRTLLAGMVAIMAFSIAWHVANGHLTGWKHLDDPKEVFVFFPAVLLLLHCHWQRRRTGFLWVLWVVLGVLTFMSGERKGWIAFGLATLLLSLRTGAQGLLVPLVAAIAVPLIVLPHVHDPYLRRLVWSLVAPVSSAIATSPDDPSGSVPVSLSNAQRMFAFEEGKRLFAEAPVFGIGTNAFEPLILHRFANLPDYMLNGIHGEFFRTLVENGAVGFLAYSLVWVISILRTSHTIARLAQHRYLDLGGIVATVLAFYVAYFVICAFEASGTSTQLILVLVGLMPELLQCICYRVFYLPATCSGAGQGGHRHERG